MWIKWKNKKKEEEREGVIKMKVLRDKYFVGVIGNYIYKKLNKTRWL